MSTPAAVWLGCAGWSLPRAQWPAFAETGTHLERYASRFNAVEINSSFYRPHQPKTYARWASSVPPGFRFAVKMPQQITHVQRLVGCEPLLEAFFGQCTALGPALGCVLVQLPPSLRFEPRVATAFFDALRQRFEGTVVIEPRHESWALAQPLLVDMRIAQVAADPPRFGNDSVPAGWPGVCYWRLHGAPRIYYSAYSPAQLKAWAQALRAALHAGVPVWCIFDNTAAGAAVADALYLQALLA